MSSVLLIDVKRQLVEQITRGARAGLQLLTSELGSIFTPDPKPANPSKCSSVAHVQKNSLFFLSNEKRN